MTTVDEAWILEKLLERTSNGEYVGIRELQKLPVSRRALEVTLDSMVNLGLVKVDLSPRPKYFRLVGSTRQVTEPYYVLTQRGYDYVIKALKQFGGAFNGT